MVSEMPCCVFEVIVQFNKVQRLVGPHHLVPDGPARMQTGAFCKLRRMHSTHTTSHIMHSTHATSHSKGLNTE